MLLIASSVQHFALLWGYQRRPTCCGCGVGWGVEAACSVFTLDTRGRGVRQEVGLPAAVATTPTPPPPAVWVTGLWGSDVGVSSVWRPWESQLGDETWRWCHIHYFHFTDIITNENIRYIISDDTQYIISCVQLTEAIHGSCHPFFVSFSLSLTNRFFFRCTAF